jgi:hypothetical protein
MKTLATVPLRLFSLRAIRQPGAALCKILSERTLISRFQYFIETTDWDEKYLCHKLIDKICLGVMILSVIYFCFCPGAYLTGMVFRTYADL